MPSANAPMRGGGDRRRDAGRAARTAVHNRRPRWRRSARSPDRSARSAAESGTRVEVDRRPPARSPPPSARRRSAARRRRPSSRGRAGRGRVPRRGAAAGGDRRRAARAGRPRRARSRRPAPASPIVPRDPEPSPARAPDPRRGERASRRTRSGSARAARRRAAKPCRRRSAGSRSARSAASSPARNAAIPRVVGQRIIQQHRLRPRALGGQIGQIDRDQLPRDIRGRIVGQEMHPLDQRIGGDDESPPSRAASSTSPSAPGWSGKLRSAERNVASSIAVGLTAFACARGEN